MNILIAKTHIVAIDEGKLTDDVKGFIFNYGLKQLLNDAGSAAKGPDEKLAMAEKKLASLYAGEVRSTRGATTVDPITAEAEKIAKAKIKAALKTQGKEVDDEKLTAMIVKFIEKYPETREAAERIVKARASAKTAVPVDLTDLGL